MKKIGQIGKINILKSSEVLFFKFTSTDIILGDYFMNLCPDSQRTVINYCLLGVEYVNSNIDATINNELLTQLDIHMNQKAYNHVLILNSLREMHQILQEVKMTDKYTDQISQELKILSERYYAFNKHCKNRFKVNQTA